ncbi:MAG: outer membrane beta-barrel protein [Bacteroidota bacterium]
MKEDKNMDNAFRDKLEGFKAEPPAYLWDGIQGQLATQRRKKRIALYSWVSVAALLVLAFLAGWYFNESAEMQKPQMAETEKIGQEEKSNIGEQGVKVPEKDNEKMDSEPVAPERFLADARERKSETQQSEEITPGSEMDEENRMLAAADLEFIQPIEISEIKMMEGEQPTGLSVKSGRESANQIFTWNQKVMHENEQLLSGSRRDNTGWKFGLNVSPGYSSYSAKHGSAYSSNMTWEADNGNANLSGGVSVQYKTGKRVSIESGVYYAQNGQQTGSSPQLFGNRAQMDYASAPVNKNYFNTAVTLADNRMAMNSTAGIIEFEGVPKGAEVAANLETFGTYSNSLLTSGELSQVFDFVEIPLYFRYLLFESKMDVELVGGVNAGLVVGNNAYIDNEYGIQNIGSTRDISPVNVSGTLGVGLNYAVGKNLSLAVEPRFNYYLNSINRNPEVDFRPYRVGVYTGLYYEF